MKSPLSRRDFLDLAQKREISHFRRRDLARDRGGLLGLFDDKLKSIVGNGSIQVKKIP